MPDMELIDVDELRKGMVIYYKWATLASSIGPCTVEHVSRDHTGPYVLLKHANGDRRISLADDEDYGPLSVYTPTEAK